MIVIWYLDWFGTKDGFEKLSDAWKKACKEVPSIKSTKLYQSHQARYHYAWITECEGYDSISKASSKMPPRDRKDLTHQVTEIFSEI
jgi:hypothetical protein